MKRWLIKDRLFVSIARASSVTGSRVWYTRNVPDRKDKSGRRMYHLVSWVKIVRRHGSFHKIVIGPLAVVFGLRPPKARR